MAREQVIRVDSTDLKYIRAAQAEVGDVPLGRAAREGCKRLLSESAEETEVSI